MTAAGITGCRYWLATIVWFEVRRYPWYNAGRMVDGGRRGAKKWLSEFWIVMRKK